MPTGLSFCFCLHLPLTDEVDFVEYASFAGLRFESRRDLVKIHLVQFEIQSDASSVRCNVKSPYLCVLQRPALTSEIVVGKQPELNILSCAYAERTQLADNSPPTAADYDFVQGISHSPQNKMRFSSAAEVETA